MYVCILWFLRQCEFIVIHKQKRQANNKERSKQISEIRIQFGEMNIDKIYDNTILYYTEFMRKERLIDYFYIKTLYPHAHIFSLVWLTC